MERTKKYTWYKIADVIEDIHFSRNNLAEVEVNGKVICIAKNNDSLFGCSQKCPHAGGIMAEGAIDIHGNIVCPLHRYRYNMKNGHNVSGEGYYLKTYPIETRADGIFIGIEDKGIFSWLK